MNELMDYFVKLGYAPEIAVKLASKIGTMTPPEAPFANGVKVDPATGVAQLLTSKYHLSPQEASAYAGRVLSGTATGSKEIMAEAQAAQQATAQKQTDATNTQQTNQMLKLGDQEYNRIGSISSFAAAAKTAEADRTPEQKKVMAAMLAETHRRMQEEAGRSSDVRVGPVKVLPSDVKVGVGPIKVLPSDDDQAAKDAAYFGGIRQHLAETTPQLGYFDGIKRWEALQDTTAANDYRAKLNADAKLGPPGPNAYIKPGE